MGGVLKETLSIKNTKKSKKTVTFILNKLLKNFGALRDFRLPVTTWQTGGKKVYFKILIYLS